MNRLLQQTVEQTPSPDAVTRYTYYSSGLLKTMKDPRLVALTSPEEYSYTYDLMGRKESVSYPPAGNGGAGGTSEIFDYDTVGRLWHFTTRGGNIQTLTYDALHRENGRKIKGRSVHTCRTSLFIMNRLLQQTVANS